MKKIFGLTLLILIILVSLAFGQTALIEIDYENSEGFWNVDTIGCGMEVEIALRYNCQYTCAYIPSNAFKISSPDDAGWSDFEGISLCPGEFCNSFDSIAISYGPGGNDGPPVDEVGFAGLVLSSATGWLTPSDITPFVIKFTTGWEEGSHIILDMTEFTNYEWVWSPNGYCDPSDDIIPVWGGPYELVLYSDMTMPPVLDNPPPGDVLSGNHCDGFMYHFRFHIMNPHPPPNAIYYSCNLGEIDENGVWTWLPDISYEDSSVTLHITATTDLGASKTYHCTLNIASNYAPEFMSGWDTTVYTNPGMTTEITYTAFDACSTDQRIYFVKDNSGFAGVYSFTDSIFSLTPVESDLAISPITMIVGVTDTQDTSLCELHLEVIPSNCCVGERGDVDCSGGDPDISDITRLIDYLYLTHASLCCPEEADVNGSGGLPDISDITRLIDFMYLSHTAIMLCSDTLTPGVGNVNNSSCLGLSEKNSTATQDCIQYTYSTGLRIVHTNAAFNCCLDKVLASVYLSNDTIYIQEIDSTLIPCDCLCLYNIAYYVYNILPGTYTISIDEPNVYGQNDIVFDVNLITEPTGNYCIERTYYPWGY